nr:ubiquitin-associated protein 1-like [Nothobranchius furzeri]
MNLCMADLTRPLRQFECRLFVGAVINILEDVPFQTPMGLLGVEVQLLSPPEITAPDCHQILQETEYGFSLEQWILTGQWPVSPSCPPIWLMPSSPQRAHKFSLRDSDLWVPRPRARSHSLSSADILWLRHRTVKFLITDSDEDDGTTAEGVLHRVNSRERPHSAAPRDLVSRVKDVHLGYPSHRAKPDTPQIIQGHRGTPSFPDCRLPLRALGQHSSLCQGQKNSKRQSSQSRKHSQNTPPARSSKLQQQRPSSAGPVVKNRRKNVLTASTSNGVLLDSAAELLTALSQEEREILETITERGYPLRTAILALQKTGYRSPEKILNYLVSSEHLCQLGYDEAQVEEALEMFQNCESKAAEFLHLLAQFNEMGFQQSAIKEVLLVHENHRERALEELMTRMA